MRCPAPADRERRTLPVAALLSVETLLLVLGERERSVLATVDQGEHLRAPCGSTSSK